MAKAVESKVIEAVASGEVPPPIAPDKSKRTHRATYAKDKIKGGYTIRVAGPNANKFAGRTVPVTMKDGSEHTEDLDKMLWFGKDKESGEPVALYSFKAKPKEKIEVEF